MFNDSFSKIPTELIKSKQLSNLEFRVICVLILISSYNNGHSFLGSFKLSDMCGIGRAALRRALHNLENMQLIKITQRGQFSRSNDILLTIPDGIRFLQHGGAAETPRRVDLNDSFHGQQVNERALLLNTIVQFFYVYALHKYVF